MITAIVTNPVVRYKRRNDQIVITTIVTNPVVTYEQRNDQIVITTIVTNPVVRYERRKGSDCHYDNCYKPSSKI